LRLSLSLLLSTSSFAGDFFAVKEKFCDGTSVEVAQNERVFVDMEKGVLGIGSTEGNCQVVDFTQVLILTKTSNPDEYKTLSVRDIGRRSTCSATSDEILPFERIRYSYALVKADSIEFSDIAGECATITYRF